MTGGDNCFKRPTSKAVENYILNSKEPSTMSDNRTQGVSQVDMAAVILERGLNLSGRKGDKKLKN